MLEVCDKLGIKEVTPRDISIKHIIVSDMLDKIPHQFLDKESGAINTGMIHVTST